MKQLAVMLFSTVFGACAVVDRDNLDYADAATVPVVYPAAETVPVPSLDDAADDPALWLHPHQSDASLVLGTDKDGGLGVYRLDGSEVQYLPAGLPHNVDLRQNVRVGTFSGDLAAASNRAADTVTLFRIRSSGAAILGDIPSALAEPYGSCMGLIGNRVTVFVTYQTGEVYAYVLGNIGAGVIDYEAGQVLEFDSQLEGCAYDDSAGVLYVGEEARGLWRSRFTGTENGLEFAAPTLVDEVDGASGTTADIEGVAIYHGDPAYLIASSQGNDSYAVYTHDEANRFLGRFRIAMHPERGIDGAQETDGLEAIAASLGPRFPEGVLIVQDGFNAPPGSAQNFKLVDWRDIKAALNLE